MRSLVILSPHIGSMDRCRCWWWLFFLLFYSIQVPIISAQRGTNPSSEQRSECLTDPVTDLVSHPVTDRVFHPMTKQNLYTKIDFLPKMIIIWSYFSDDHCDETPLSYAHHQIRQVLFRTSLSSEHLTGQSLLSTEPDLHWFL